ncbi:hypothetical protein [Nostoc sp. PA-18-2419]|uniref:hypothetical protein n=1 Tax=Nostoc sp. PA-18-2419 TaxID=2575443 RepID=UPI001678476F|nr:hypothetical protein [Nostoc sp. PA-18-2419]
MGSQSQTPKGKIVWREVKIALVARLGEYKKRSGEEVLELCKENQSPMTIHQFGT